MSCSCFGGVEELIGEGADGDEVGVVEVVGVRVGGGGVGGKECREGVFRFWGDGV